MLFFVCISFVLFNADTIAQAGADLRGMFGLTGIPFVTGETRYYLKSFGVLFVSGIVGATPVVRSLACRIARTRIGSVLEPILLLVILALCTAYLVDGSFSPFLYFRF